MAPPQAQADSYTGIEGERPQKKPDTKLGTFGTEAKCLIKPGDYDVMFLDYRTWMMFGRRPKICLKFRITTPGDAFGQVIDKHYNVARIGKNRTFKVGFTSRFLRDFVRLLGPISRGRLDRIPMTRFESNVFRAKVETVKSGNDGVDNYEIHESLQYSVIRDLVMVVEGSNAPRLAPTLIPIPAPIPIPTENGGSR